MDPLVALVLATVCGYLVGSLSFAVIVSRLFGLPDPHSYGSGNPGATNVLRTGRKLAAALTLAGDAGKGAAAVALAGLIAPGTADAAALAGIAAFLGHLFPVFFGFRGGKGVATAAGILVALDPRLGGLVLGVWLAIAVIFRYSSLAALSAAFVAPFVAAWLGASPVGTVAVVAMSALLLWRHRGNLSRLLAGQETRIGGGRRTPG